MAAAHWVNVSMRFNETDPVTGLPGVRAWVKSIGWDEWFLAEKVDTSPAVPLIQSIITWSMTVK